MKFGMPSLIECGSLEENAEIAKELGFDFIELNMNIPAFTPTGTRAEKLKRLKEDYDIELTVHLPEEMDLSSFQPAIRKGHVQCCKEAILWAEAANINLLNMHLNKGIFFTLPDQKVYLNQKFQNEFLSHLLESYHELYDFAEQHGVTLCIENTSNFHIPFIRQAIEELSHFNAFSLTWDVGHDARTDYQESEVFHDFADRVKHMHLHDVVSRKDHQPLFTGSVPINDRLAFAENHKCRVLIEVKTYRSLKESVRNIKAK